MCFQTACFKYQKMEMSTFFAEFKRLFQAQEQAQEQKQQQISRS